MYDKQTVSLSNKSLQCKSEPFFIMVVATESIRKLDTNLAPE